MFHNLISNAIKYCHETPVIEISHKLTDRLEGTISTKCIELYFKDNGIGFPSEHKDEIFKPFKRLKSKEEYEGSGIGLALVKRIVESHRGSISAESVLNKGSLFKLVLPVSQTYN